MTENMAGRGEGLAGRLQAILDSHPYEHETTIAGYVRLQEQIATVCEALEAAAPAGTARRSKLELSIAKECLKPAIDLLNDAIWNYRETVTIKRGDLNYAVELAREALATPSPQAPTNDVLCPENEQDATTAEESGIRSAGRFFSADKYDRNSPLVQAIERGYEKWHAAGCHESSCGCVTVYIHKELAGIVPAATQEPAGSGAQWSCLNFDHACNLRGYCVNKNCTEFGSPRKVGEDAQPSKLRPTYYVRHPDDTFSVADPQPVKEFKAILQQRIKDILAARNEYEEGDTATSHCFHLMEVERILDGKSVGFGELARPSSVPVGEQKQEDGA